MVRRQPAALTSRDRVMEVLWSTGTAVSPFPCDAPPTQTTAWTATDGTHENTSGFHGRWLQLAGLLRWLLMHRSWSYSTYAPMGYLSTYGHRTCTYTHPSPRFTPALIFKGDPIHAAHLSSNPIPTRNMVLACPRRFVAIPIWFRTRPMRLSVMVIPQRFL